MVDITIDNPVVMVFMGFINQQTKLRGSPSCGNVMDFFSTGYSKVAGKSPSHTGSSWEMYPLAIKCGNGKFPTCR
jgi:hypothetical protein